MAWQLAGNVRKSIEAPLGQLHSEIGVCQAELQATKAAIALESEQGRGALKSAFLDAIAALPKPQDGRDGKDGASITVDDIAPLVAAEVNRVFAKAKADIEPRPVIDEAALAAMVSAEVAKAVAALPVPVPKDGRDGLDGKDGSSVTVEDVRHVIGAEVTRQVGELPKPADPVGIMGAVIDRKGALILTLSDGTTKNVGRVVGRPPDPEMVAQAIAAEVAKIPAPKDGKDGRDGSVENLKALYDGERTVTWCFKNGDPVEGGVMTLPIPIWRGIWGAGKTYEPHDVVQWDGSQWYALKAVSAKPGDESPDSRDWKLWVKRGRDGAKGPQGDRGLDGKDGKDAESKKPWST